MGAVVSEPRYWFVSLTVSGDKADEATLQRGLRELNRQRPFLQSIRFDQVHAELQYWEEADSLVDAASLALRLWNEHRESAGLPKWEVVGLEVVERAVRQQRRRAVAPQRADLGNVVPLRF